MSVTREAGEKLKTDPSLPPVVSSSPPESPVARR